MQFNEIILITILITIFIFGVNIRMLLQVIIDYLKIIANDEYGKKSDKFKNFNTELWGNIVQSILIIIAVLGFVLALHYFLV